MSQQANRDYGTLEHLSAGRQIPLLTEQVVLGRRKSCDVLVEYPNISSQHARLNFELGYWFISDLNSRNGVRVSGKRILTGVRKLVVPNCEIKLAKHAFVIRYDPESLGASPDLPPDQPDDSDNKSLLDKAGLGGQGSMKGIRRWDDPKRPRPLGGAADPSESG